MTERTVDGRDNIPGSKTRGAGAGTVRYHYNQDSRRTDIEAHSLFDGIIKFANRQARPIGGIHPEFFLVAPLSETNTNPVVFPRTVAINTSKIYRL